MRSIFCKARMGLSARKSIVARERLNNNSYQLPSEPEKNQGEGNSY